VLTSFSSPFEGHRLHNTRLEGSGSHRCAASMCAPVLPAPQAAGVHQKRHTLASVARHATPDDCWLIVRGKVYDVTGWAAQHPGGALIFVKAGGECTQLFDSYHPLSARRAPPPKALSPRRPRPPSLLQWVSVARRSTAGPAHGAGAVLGHRPWRGTQVPMQSDALCVGSPVALWGVCGGACAPRRWR
jgi:hypothetical protein